MKVLHSRIKNKKDTETNWELNNPMILDGEIIIVDCGSAGLKLKIGNGEKLYSELPFYGTIYAEKPSYSVDEIVGLPEALQATIPVGIIMIWSGSANNVPKGWALCDGANGTPDLADKFVIAAGTAYPVGAQGGEVEHTLTELEMPAHDHEFDRHQLWRDEQVPPSTTTQGEGYGANNKTLPVYTDTVVATGAGEAHNNMPPYYSLCYIMKI